MGYRILLADDEHEIIDFLKLYLDKEGYQIVEAADGKAAYEKIQTEKIDLALIDIMMPHVNGFELIKLIRETHNIPVIILSAKCEASDKILGLGLGADDYITKPFEPLEVVARVDANIRRFYKLGASEEQKQEEIMARDLRLDLKQCVLFKRLEKQEEQLIELTSIEFKILQLFMQSPGRVFTKKQIYEAAWEDSYVTDDNNIMVYISKLRNKLGENEESPYIKTIRGLGYKFIPVE